MVVRRRNSKVFSGALPSGLLEAKNLGKTYGKKPVVRNVSMHLKRGEVVGLLGPNGAGKTTCFYMIIGLVTPDYGTISLNDYDVTGMPMYRRARLGLGLFAAGSFDFPRVDG